MKKYSKYILVVLIITTILFFGTKNIKATEENQNDNFINKSEEFRKWESLSEEERQYALQPMLVDTSIKDSVKRSRYNAILQASNLETSYNLKDYINIRVKDQKHTNSCWAFAFSSMVETTLAKKYNDNQREYSPMHTEYKVSSTYNKSVIDGGNAFLALAYSTAGYGPVYETDLPFDSVYNEETNSSSNYYLKELNTVDTNKNARLTVTDSTLFGTIYKEYRGNSIIYKDVEETDQAKIYTQNEVNAIRNLIKQHIKEYGAVQSTMYSKLAFSQNGTIVDTENFFNSNTNSYYCNNTSKVANHAITIVGWDDDYSRNNFNSQNKPINNGAYIVLNSWGSNLLDGGYFYISYDDVFIEQNVIGLNKLEKTELASLSYDNIYQYDELGASLPLYYFNENSDDAYSEGYAANVFERKDTSKDEYLNEVSVYLTETEGIEIYVNPNGNDLKVQDSTLVASYTGTNALEAGYHRLKLASPLKIEGNKFSIIVKYINQEGASTILECNIKDSGITNASNFFDTAKSNSGESYISTDGINWKDLSNYRYADYVLKNSNVCIKAFTSVSEKLADNPQESNPSTEVKVESIRLNKESTSVQVGEKINLIATISPTNATEKEIRWTSSDENIATVSSSGIITAKSSGTVTITAITKDGNKVATCEVAVTAKTSSSDDIYKSNTNSQSSGNSNKDTTTSSKIIPYAGRKTVIIILFITLVLGIIIFIRYRSLKDVK